MYCNRILVVPHSENDPIFFTHIFTHGKPTEKIFYLQIFPD